MLIDYYKFDFIKYKHYVINDNFNLNLLNTLEQFIHITKKTNLSYYLSGSIALSFLTNKIYRTWNDIDIIIDKHTMSEWSRLFDTKSWHYHDLDPTSTKFFNKRNNNYVELSIETSKFNLHSKKYLKITDYNGIKISNAKIILYWKQNSKREQKKFGDNDDVIFFKEYIS
jgi:hypothetical protein